MRLITDDGFSSDRVEATGSRCFGFEPTIFATGTVITGTNRSDIIMGTAGDETITGLQGNDPICGADGAEAMSASLLGRLGLGDDLDT